MLLQGSPSTATLEMKKKKKKFKNLLTDKKPYVILTM